MQWTFWEYAMCRIWASGGADFATNAQILADPKLLALNIFWVLAIPIWRDLHFYMGHRFIHIRWCAICGHRNTGGLGGEGARVSGEGPLASHG